MQRILTPLLSSIILLLTGCFYSPKVEQMPVEKSKLKVALANQKRPASRRYGTSQLDSLSKDSYTKIPAKIFLDDGTVALFQTGYIVTDTSIKGTAELFGLNGKNYKSQTIEIQLDKIIAITSYDHQTSSSAGIASFLLTVTGPPITMIATYCLVCPKCCFGSCPTVYVPKADKMELKAELFSHCISAKLEDNDLDLLVDGVEKNPNWPLKITNEALETHYINRLNLQAVFHQPDTKVIPDNLNGIISFGSENQPERVINSKGCDVTAQVSYTDNQNYRTDTDITKQMAKSFKPDNLQVKVKVPAGAKEAKLKLTYRNTLLSTYLFYEVVLASQGLDAVSWQNRMNTDTKYAADFKRIYDLFSGISVAKQENDNWQTIGRLPDAGPLTFKECGIRIPLTANQDSLELKLEFVPDNFFIDQISFDFSNDETLEVVDLQPEKVKNVNGVVQPEIISQISIDDEQYLITEPGDSYDFYYNMPVRAGLKTAIFASSKGYYNEWVRGKWIREDNSNYSFNLYRPDQIFAQLSNGWLKNRELMEDTFFNTKVKLKECK